MKGDGSYFVCPLKMKTKMNKKILCFFTIRSPFPLMEPTDKQKEELGEYAETSRHFWTAPELLNSKYAQVPTPPCDVYSFAIILNEIFSRDDPYSQEVAEMGVKEVSFKWLYSRYCFSSK